jgi:hypothetical protein
MLILMFTEIFEPRDRIPGFMAESNSRTGGTKNKDSVIVRMASVRKCIFTGSGINDEERLSGAEKA